jgi:acyl dehydratase
MIKTMLKTDSKMTVETLKAQERLDLGSSNWLHIDQSLIDTFGQVTFDPDRMHIDPVWAAANSPYGGTIVFGFQTLALLSHFSHEIFDAVGLETAFDPIAGHALNYGFNRVRFIAPVRVGKRIRAHISKISANDDRPGQTLFCFDINIEIENEDRPALVAEWLWLWVPREQR